MEVLGRGWVYQRDERSIRVNCGVGNKINQDFRSMIKCQTEHRLFYVLLSPVLYDKLKTWLMNRRGSFTVFE